MNTLISREGTSSQLEVAFPAGCRRILAWKVDDGALMTQPVPDSASVLDLQEELISHLSSFPVSDEWLQELMSYVQARLEARRAARRTGGTAILGTDRTWAVVQRMPTGLEVEQ